MRQLQKKTATLNLRIDPDLKEAAMRAAAAERRSITSLIEKLIADYTQKARA